MTDDSLILFTGLMRKPRPICKWPDLLRLDSGQATYVNVTCLLHVCEALLLTGRQVPLKWFLSVLDLIFSYWLL